VSREKMIGAMALSIVFVIFSLGTVVVTTFLIDYSEYAGLERRLAPTWEGTLDKWFKVILCLSPVLIAPIAYLTGGESVEPPGPERAPRTSSNGEREGVGESTNSSEEL